MKQPLANTLQFLINSNGSESQITAETCNETVLLMYDNQFKLFKMGRPYEGKSLWHSEQVQMSGIQTSTT